MSKGFRFQGTVLIANQEFTAAITKNNEDILLNLFWTNSMGISMKEMLTSLSEQMEIVSVEAIPFDFQVQKIGISYNMGKKAFLFHTAITNETKEQLAILDIFAEEVQGFGVLMKLATTIPFSHIPILGKMMEGEDGITGILLSIRKQPHKEMEWGLLLTCRFQNQNTSISLGDIYDKNVIQEAVSMPEEASVQEPEKNAERSIERDTKKDTEKEQTESLTDDLGVKWFSLDKAVGPFTIKRIGALAKEEGEEFKVFLYLDVKMSFSIIEVELMGLHAGIPVSAMTDFHLSSLKKLEFGMSGLGVRYQKDPLYINGCFYRSNGIQERYDGAVVIKYMQFQFVGMGSYTTTEDGKASLFLYLMVGYPIGGTAGFFITGLAAGFGINRALKIPDVKQIKSFPLISIVMQKQADLSMDQVILQMKDCIYESKGGYFIAAGIQFTSYELLQTFALAIVTFGKEFEVQLLGLSTFSMPPKVKNPFLYAELAIKAVIAPKKGIVSFEGALTSESYLFSRDCRLTGGFALYLWFLGEHKGDFVITIGGYHPKFAKPAHYPAVDRVGISWKIGQHLSMKGEGYFAVTSTAVMAGGAAQFLFEMGNLKAWFFANADFLISWAPFYYDIDIGVSVGVSYTVKILFVRVKLKVELGARLHLFGPEFAGSVYICWHIISFTIRFGNKNPSPVPMSYTEFKEKFLKEPLQMQVGEGLQGEYEKAGEKISLVNIKKAAFQLESRIPLTSIVLGSYGNPDKPEPKELDIPDIPIGVLPMGEGKRLFTTNTVLLYRKKENQVGEEYYEEITDISNYMSWELITENLPHALFGTKQCSMLEVKFVKGAVTGIRLIPKSDGEVEKGVHFTPFYPLKELTKNDELYLDDLCTPCSKEVSVEDDFRLELATIMTKMKNHRPKEQNMKIIKESKKKTLEYFKQLMPDVWQADKLDDADLYLEPNNHFLIQPLKRTVI